MPKQLPKNERRSQSQYSRHLSLKSGTARFMPSLKNIIMLADYFNCSIEFLLGIDDENKLPHPKKQLPDFGAHFKKVLKEKGKQSLQAFSACGLQKHKPLLRLINGKSTPRIDSLYKISKRSGLLDRLSARENNKRRLPPSFFFLFHDTILTGSTRYRYSSVSARRNYAGRNTRSEIHLYEIVVHCSQAIRNVLCVESYIQVLAF